jgi:hypothetical protein
MGGLPLRIELPVGLAAVIGALPVSVRDRLPKLPSAPPVTLVATDAFRPLSDARVVDELTAVSGGVVPFLRRLSGRHEPVLLSLTGPITLGLDLRRRGTSDIEASRLATDAVGNVGARLIEMTGRLLPDAPVLLFLQEPALTNSMHPAFPMTPIEIEFTLTGVVDELTRSRDAVVGLQLDGRADWASLLRTGIGALAAPVTAHLETAAAELGRFLDSGGIVAWGAVPVDEPLGLSAERLWRRLSDLWCELTRLGIDPLLLRERSIITPAAGLGNFGTSQAERIVTLAEDLATRVLHQTLGVRLSIGA